MHTTHAAASPTLFSGNSVPSLNMVQNSHSSTSPEIKLQSGITIPTIGLGTYGFIKESDIEHIQKAIDLGYRFIDTATSYGNHIIIGKAIKKYNRKSLIICTKLNNADFESTTVEKAIDKVLQEINTDYVDMVLLHNPKINHFPQILADLIKLKKSGKIKSVSVSNFEIHHLEAVKTLFSDIDINQIELHPYLYQTELNEYCKKNNIHIMGYRPLANNKIHFNNDPMLLKIAEETKRTIPEVILRAITQSGHSVIVKSTDARHLQSNQKIFDFQLSDTELSKIRGLNKGYRTCKDPRYTDFDLTFPIKEIYEIAKVDALNIEADDLAKKAKVWFNLTMNLDTPFASKEAKNYAEISQDSKAYLKELTIKNYNIIRSFVAILLITNYCINEGRTIKPLAKPLTETLRFLIHIHRGEKASIAMMQIITEVLMQCFPHRFEKTTDKQYPLLIVLKDKNKNVVIQFRYGYGQELKGEVYDNADIGFSCSMVAGLRPDSKASDLGMPEQSVSFDVKKNVLSINDSRLFKNHLIDQIDRVVTQPQILFIEELNNNFEKYFKQPLDCERTEHRTLLVSDFKKIRLLKANGIFCPTDPQKYFSITQTTDNKMAPTSSVGSFTSTSDSKRTTLGSH